MTPAQVAVLLNEDVVMHTPILIKPIVGRELVESKIDARTTLLRWQGTVEGHKIESLELLTRRRERTAAGAHSRIQAVSGSQDIQRSADRSERR